MAISIKMLKMLWGRSGSRCAICRKELVLDPIESDDDESIVGDMAHIVAQKEGFTRGDFAGLPIEQRDKYSNLVLLCKIHHKQIDDQPSHYTVERLLDIKSVHERWVREQLTPKEESRIRADEIYAAYLEEFLTRIEIQDWTTNGTFVGAPDGAQIRRGQFQSWKDLNPWLVSRVWPNLYPELDAAFVNFRIILQDLVRVFERHLEDIGYDQYFTEKFYKKCIVTQQEYNRLAELYEKHTALVEDLFLELTRGLNYICDHVRTYLLPSFRIHDGAVLVRRYFVCDDMHSEYIRPEYRGKERVSRPYPGLEAFQDVRFTRDFHVIQ